jgi:hypothetical protein
MALMGCSCVDDCSEKVFYDECDWVYFSYQTHRFHIDVMLEIPYVSTS